MNPSRILSQEARLGSWEIDRGIVLSTTYFAIMFKLSLHNMSSAIA
jgi:hypothetical protein